MANSADSKSLRSPVMPALTFEPAHVMLLATAPVSGDVAKWQGRGLQNPHQRFESARRLFLFQTPRQVLVVSLAVYAQSQKYDAL